MATRGDAQALVNTLADSQAEMDVETLGDILIEPEALVEKLADKVGEVAA